MKIGERLIVTIISKDETRVMNYSSDVDVKILQKRKNEVNPGEIWRVIVVQKRDHPTIFYLARPIKKLS